jgi:hypothetical protein
VVVHLRERYRPLLASLIKEYQKRYPQEPVPSYKEVIEALLDGYAQIYLSVPTQEKENLPKD